MYLEEKNKGLALTSLAKVIIILAGVVLGFLLSRIIILPFTIPNDSMSPNLRKGDIVFILKHIPCHLPHFGSSIVECDEKFLRIYRAVGIFVTQVADELLADDTNTMKFL